MEQQTSFGPIIFQPSIQIKFKSNLLSNRTLWSSNLYRICHIKWYTGCWYKFISIYRNPTNGSFTVARNSIEPYNISVFSLSGGIVKEVHKCLNNFNVNILDYTSGIYLIKISGQSDSFVGKMVKNWQHLLVHITACDTN